MTHSDASTPGQNPDLAADTPTPESELDSGTNGRSSTDDVEKKVVDRNQEEAKDKKSHSDLPLSTLIADLSENLDATDDAILREEFAKDGVGNLGILYKRLAAAEGVAAEEGWAKFLEFAQVLWAHEHYRATRHLLASAQLHLSPPENYVDQIKDSIEFADDFMIIERIGARFDDGDDEGAVSLTEGLSAQSRKAARDAIQAGIEARRKSRKTAFFLAGIFGVMLVGANIIGFKIIADMARTPPSFSLPEFQPNPESPFFDSSSDAPQTPGPNGGSPDTPSLPEGVDTPNRETSAPHAEDATETPLPALPKDTQEPPEQEESSMQSTETPEAPTGTAPDPERIYNCALARRVVSQGELIATDRNDPDAVDRLRAFSETTQQACANTGVSDAQIDQVGSIIPDEDIRRIALGILNGS